MRSAQKSTKMFESLAGWSNLTFLYFEEMLDLNTLVFLI